MSLINIAMAYLGLRHYGHKSGTYMWVFGTHTSVYGIGVMEHTYMVKYETSINSWSHDIKLMTQIKYGVIKLINNRHKCEWHCAALMHNV